MQEGVKPRSAEMEAIRVPLIVQVFKFLDKLDEKRVSFSDLGNIDRTLHEYPSSMNKFAEIPPIFLGENSLKETGSKTENIQPILSCFISTGDFLNRIAWWTMKKGWKMFGRFCNELPMLNPSVVDECCPIPTILLVRTTRELITSPFRASQARIPKPLFSR